MSAGELFFLVMILTPVILFWGISYGDYKAEGRWFWQSSKDDTNSGAKFG